MTNRISIEYYRIEWKENPGNTSIRLNIHCWTRDCVRISHLYNFYTDSFNFEKISNFLFPSWSPRLLFFFFLIFLTFESFNFSLLSIDSFIPRRTRYFYANVCNTTLESRNSNKRTYTMYHRDNARVKQLHKSIR